MTPCLNQQALQPQRRAPPTAQVRVPQDRRPFSPRCPLAPLTTLHRPIVPFFSPQTADSSAWWTGAVPAQGEWRSLTRAPGAPSVMTAGTWTMPTWCAGSWTVEKPSAPWGLLTSGQDQGPFGWTTWTAQEMSLTCGGALPKAGGSMTADTSRTRGSSAQVCAAHGPQAGGGMGPWRTGFWALRERCWKDQRRRLPPMEPVFPADEVLSLPPASAEILVLSSQPCFLPELFLTVSTWKQHSLCSSLS